MCLGVWRFVQAWLCRHRPLAALLLLFMGLALLYNVATPLFEAPDEADHFSYARWLATGRGLPDIAADRQNVGEIWQPPLYYAAVALLIAPIDTSDFGTVAPFNPYWPLGAGPMAHTHTAAEAFPYRQTALAVHLARFLSTLMGVATILSTVGIARRLLPDYVLVAAALIALNPQFIALSAAVNNDNLVIALCSVTLWLLARQWGQDGLSWRRYVLLGGLWGLAALAKPTGLALGGVIGLALVLAGRPLTADGRRALVVAAGVVGGSFMVVGGWWYGRNWLLHGDPLAWEVYLEITRGLLRPELLSWPETLRYASFLHKTYWAAFGYGLLAPELFYLFTDGVMVLALLGLGRWVLFNAETRRTRSIFLVLVAWSLLVLALLLRWMRQIEATNHGRLLFPAAAALTILLALGLYQWDSRRKWLGMGVAAVLGAWAAAMPFLVLQPAYAQPELLAATAVIPHPISIHFGDGIALLGYELADADIQAGESVEVELYWQATRPITESYVVAVRLLDAAGQVVAGMDTIPYQARYPTVVWPVGRPFHDTYRLPPVAETAAPGLGTLLVIVYPFGRPDEPLPVVADGRAVGNEARLSSVKISPAEVARYEPLQTADAIFNDQFRLLGYELGGVVAAGEALTVTLYWEGLQPDGRDYTVFVHLLDAAGGLVAQGDSPPQNGRYPTSIWAAGEQVRDEHEVALPAGLPTGAYEWQVGLYDPITDQRLPAFRADGAHWPDDSALLAVVKSNP